MRRNKTAHTKKKEFSKVLLVQESILIWITTLTFLGLAALCILRDYTGSLPWLTAMISLPWTAYGVSQCFYYNKAKAENTKEGIKYEAVMAEILDSAIDEPFPTEEMEQEVAGEKVDIDYGI